MAYTPPAEPPVAATQPQPAVPPAAQPTVVRSPGRLAVIAVCLLSLLVGGVGVVIGLLAYAEASKARDEARALTGQRQDLTQPAAATPTATRNAAPTTAAAPRTTTEAIDPRATYVSSYDDKKLVITPAGNCGYQYLNVDEPSVQPGGSSSTADLKVSTNCSGRPPILELSYGQFADANGKRMTPNECAEAIRSAPLPTDADVPLRKGVTVCLVTSQSQAVSQGIKRKMVLVEVLEIRSDGKIDFRVDAWDLPY